MEAEGLTGMLLPKTANHLMDQYMHGTRRIRYVSSCTMCVEEITMRGPGQPVGGWGKKSAEQPWIASTAMGHVVMMKRATARVRKNDSRTG